MMYGKLSEPLLAALKTPYFTIRLEEVIRSAAPKNAYIIRPSKAIILTFDW